MIAGRGGCDEAKARVRLLIGILSDTHDRADAARAAIELLRRSSAAFYIHCGDVGGEKVIDQLAGLPAAFVWGNNDWDRAPLEKYAQSLGVRCFGDLAELELGGKSFAVIHGDNAALRRRLLDEQRHDYLLQGHTHVPLDTRIRRTRIINPGALQRASEKTVALLETTADQLRFLRVAI